jgi:nucleoside-diphosphate-sugar epimerase
MSMHIVVTGASGFVGQALVARLLRDHERGLRRLQALTLVDVNFSGQPGGPVRQVAGSIADAAVVAQAFAQDVDQVFHLASIPGGTAEQYYALSRDVNLLGTQNLLEAAKAQAERGAPVARFVFASSIAVYGSPLPALVNDDTALSPQMTYGAQKLMGEILVADFNRRGWVNGCSLRLPGVLARPPARTGQLSAFMSDIIRELAAGRAFTCPTSPRASTWASSVHNVVGNLLHAAQVDSARLPARRALALPTLHFTMGQLVEAIAAVHGPRVRELIRWAPDERIETLFGRFPPLTTPAADAAGFRNDGDLPTLVRRAIEAF